MDYHLHSCFSADSSAPLETMCHAAVRLGLREIAFAEHVDFAPQDLGYGRFRAEGYLAEVERCQRVFAGQLVIRAGLELGDPHLYARQAAEVLGHGDYDFVIGSVHWVQGRPAFSRKLFPEEETDEAGGDGVAETWRRYFGAVAEAVEAGGFSVLGHLDLPKRSAPASCGRFRPEEHADAIRAILRRLVEKGIGLEVNTSGLRSAAGEPCPGLTILRWYRELGAELITVGSDAHDPSQVGQGVDVARELARRAGFSRVARYQRLRPV